MKIISNFLVAVLLLSTTSVFAKGGDDVGNGGFAYGQSVKILKMATHALEEKIRSSSLKDLEDFPERRLILQDTLKYLNLDKLSKKNQSRGGQKLAMNYTIKPNVVIVLMPYFDAFAGKTDSELEDASLEVQKRLLHEAAHIWGYKEDPAEKFAVEFLEGKAGTRPTNQIDIKNNFCSCINGKADSLSSNCDQTCSLKPKTSAPILYLNTIMGTDILLNRKLGNLYNWCNVQLSGDITAPQCFLSATDGVNVIANIPVTINPGSNSLAANIQALSIDKTYILKIVEGQTGSDAQSKEIQIRRKKQSPTNPGDLRALRVTPVNQYTCVHFGGTRIPNGPISRTSFYRQFYYFTNNETPPPVPPSRDANEQNIVCHDEQIYPGNDSAEYPRLELIPNLFPMWDRADPRFTNNVGENINTILEKRLLNEYGVNTQLDLFNLINYPNRPTISSSSTANIPLGFMMKPFTDIAGRSFCPTQVEYNDENQPLFNLLGEYMDDTEGLYLAEKEAETILDDSTSKTVYGTMFVSESVIKAYSFYIENGVKIRTTQSAMNNKTIYYYWPTSRMMDPTIKGSRKLFTVRTPATLNGNIPTGIPTTTVTSDKRIGCIPKGSL
jgi:uncharacterized protein YfeS